MCRWNKFLRSEIIQLPADLEQVPDIFVYLVRDNLKGVCFTRIKAAKLQANGAGELLGFTNPTDWFLLQEDKSVDALDTVFFNDLLGDASCNAIP